MMSNCSPCSCSCTPCCCQPFYGGPSTTTTTRDPNASTTTTTTVCEEVIPAECIIYNYTFLEEYGVNPGDSLADILNLIAQFLCVCTTSTTSTTTTSTSTTSTTSTSTTSTSTSTTSTTSTSTTSTSTTSTTSSTTSTTSTTSSSTTTTTTINPATLRPLFLAGDFTGFAYQGTQTDSRIWSYDPVGDTYQAVTVIGSIIDGTDIAHTPNKMWILKTDGSDSLIYEYDLDLSTLTATQTISYIISGKVLGPALCAINDTTLVVVEDNIGTTADVYEVALDSNSGVATLTYKFTMDDVVNVVGDLVVTTDKIIITVKAVDTYGYARQYDYTTGTLEVNADGSLNNAGISWGMFEHDGSLYFITVADWIIENININSPYDTLSYVGYSYPTVGWIVGASSIPSQNVVNLIR